ncbi:MAG: amidase [Anaerolineae bacterium]|nr:amidase [Anaerolineae bacterium]
MTRARWPVSAFWLLGALGLIGATALALAQGHGDAAPFTLVTATPAAINRPLRLLDFTPFEEAMDTLTDTRLAELDDLVFEVSITDLQAAFANGDLTAEELTRYYLHRIQAYDADGLHAVLELNPQALAIARALDAERAAGTVRGPLHGIPVLLKDNIGTGDDLHTTAGAAALIGAHADRDAFIVARLREAGAIILGKTNLSEWANFISSDLPNGFAAVGGQTRHPYGDFDPGGSSTGSAVAVSANLVTVAIGTETQGSIISPASASSVVGLYPSRTIVSRDRVIPLTGHMDSAGPIGRSVADVAVVLTVIIGVDTNDPATADAAAFDGVAFTQFLDADALQGVRVGVVMQPGVDEATFVRTFLTQPVADAFAAAGAELVFVPQPPVEADVMTVFFHDFRIEAAAYLSATGAPVSTLAEVVALNAANAETHIPYGQDLLARTAADTADAAEILALAEQNRVTMAGVLRGLLADYEVDVLVSLNNELAGHYAPAGFPAITVPGGYRRDGEPFGVTIVGDHLSDGDLIGYAYAFEQASGVRIPPPVGVPVGVPGE